MASNSSSSTMQSFFDLSMTPIQVRRIAVEVAVGDSEFRCPARQPRCSTPSKQSKRLSKAKPDVGETEQVNDTEGLQTRSMRQSKQQDVSTISSTRPKENQRHSSTIRSETMCTSDTEQWTTVNDETVLGSGIETRTPGMVKESCGRSAKLRSVDSRSQLVTKTSDSKGLTQLTAESYKEHSQQPVIQHCQNNANAEERIQDETCKNPENSDKPCGGVILNSINKSARYSTKKSFSNSANSSNKATGQNCSIEAALRPDPRIKFKDKRSKTTATEKSANSLTRITDGSDRLTASSTFRKEPHSSECTSTAGERPVEKSRSKRALATAERSAQSLKKHEPVEKRTLTKEHVKSSKTDIKSNKKASKIEVKRSKIALHKEMTADTKEKKLPKNTRSVNKQSGLTLETDGGNKTVNQNKRVRKTKASTKKIQPKKVGIKSQKRMAEVDASLEDQVTKKPKVQDVQVCNHFSISCSIKTW